MKKVGLALSGGAAHGVAHIGVIQVLLENHIPIDYVSGCSAGAVIGGLFCTGNDIYSLGRLATSLDMSSFIDITMPELGLVKGEKAEQLMELLCQNKNFNDCDPPFSAIACDIITGSSVMLNKGSVSKACHASFAMPGIFVPVQHQDMQLIDGGVVTRVPINAVKEMGADYVIAVDVGYQGTGHKKASNIMEIIMDAFEMCDWQNAEKLQKKCDCLIDPDLKDIPLHNLEHSKEAITLGREAALKVIDKIKSEIF